MPNIQTTLSTLILSCHILKNEDWRAEIGIWRSWISVEHCEFSASALAGDRVKSVARWAGAWWRWVQLCDCLPLHTTETLQTVVLPTFLTENSKPGNVMTIYLDTWTGSMIYWCTLLGDVCDKDRADNLVIYYYKSAWKEYLHKLCISVQGWWHSYYPSCQMNKRNDIFPSPLSLAGISVSPEPRITSRSHPPGEY